MRNQLYESHSLLVGKARSWPRYGSTQHWSIASRGGTHGCHGHHGLTQVSLAPAPPQMLHMLRPGGLILFSQSRWQDKPHLGRRLKIEEVENAKRSLLKLVTKRRMWKRARAPRLLVRVLSVSSPLAIMQYTTLASPPILESPSRRAASADEWIANRWRHQPSHDPTELRSLRRRRQVVRVAHLHYEAHPHN